MLFDTDILIWIQRGNVLAAKWFEEASERNISIQTYMELLQCAPSKSHLKVTQEFLRDFEVKTLPLTENIGHRAAVYVEEYTLSNSLRAGDAIIAATAVENKLTLVTGNQKHFKPIHSLQLKVFRA